MCCFLAVINVSIVTVCWKNENNLNTDYLSFFLVAVTKVLWPREASLPCRLPPPASSWQMDSLGVLCQSLIGCPSAEQGLGETLQNRRVKKLCITLLNSYQLQDHRLIHIGRPFWNLFSRPELAELPQLCLVHHILQSSKTSGSAELNQLIWLWGTQNGIRYPRCGLTSAE